MKRFHEPITAYPINKPIDTGIHFDVQLPGCVPEFEAWEAATAANCDMEKWLQPNGYPTDFKAQVIAWYRLSRAVATHATDAQNLAMQRQMKK